MDPVAVEIMVLVVVVAIRITDGHMAVQADMDLQAMATMVIWPIVDRQELDRQEVVEFKSRLLT